MPFPYNIFAPISPSDIPWKLFALLIGGMYLYWGYRGVKYKETIFKSWGIANWKWTKGSGAQTLGVLYIVGGSLGLLYGLLYFYYLAFPPHIPHYTITHLSISPSLVSADGNSSATVIFTVENESGSPSGGQTVSLQSDQNVFINPAQETTNNSTGKVAFSAISETSGVHSIDAKIYNQPLIHLGEMIVVTPDTKSKTTPLPFQ